MRRWSSRADGATTFGGEADTTIAECANADGIEGILPGSGAAVPDTVHTLVTADLDRGGARPPRDSPCRGAWRRRGADLRLPAWQVVERAPMPFEKPPDPTPPAFGDALSREAAPFA